MKNLHPNEKVVRRGNACLIQDQNREYGELILTNERLIFQSNGSWAELRLFDLINIEKMRSKIFGIIPFRRNSLFFVSAIGESILTEVEERELWIAEINNQKKQKRYA